MNFRSKLGAWLGVVCLAVFFTVFGTPFEFVGGGQDAFAQDASTSIAPKAPGSSVRPPALQKWGGPAAVPTNVVPQPSKPTVWGRIRLGAKGFVSTPDLNAGLLVQSQGQRWREFRMKDLTQFGTRMLVAVIVVLFIYFILRGRIKISKGWSGRTLLRFNNLERFTHWLTAVPFIILGLTGLNLMYGRDVVLPIIGPEAFSTSLIAGKYLHNFMGFAFILGIILMIVLWVRDNIWDKYDLNWILAAGGLFSKNSHPLAKKFNTGQKFIFWSVVIAGGSLAFSGIALMFPFELSPFEPTFALLNSIGFNLPTNLEAIQEMQLMQAWHAILALVMIGVIIAHIYIGTLGMEGAIDAMWSGEVDENWARDHHAAWVAEVKGEPEPAPGNNHPAGSEAGVPEAGVTESASND